MFHEMTRYCHPFQAPDEIEFGGFSDAVEPFTSGIAGTLRPEMLGNDSFLLCIIIAIILLVLMNIRQSHRFFSMFSVDLFGGRKQPDRLSERTMSEIRAMVVFVLMLCVCESLLLLPFLRETVGRTPSRLIPPLIGMLTGVTLLYYIFQFGVYRLIGYVFADRNATRQWLRGFNASQILLGWTLVLPALAVLFYPATIPYLLPAAVVLYILARILFFSKGFRIFYHGFSSLLYFILYLCSVEIVPLIFISGIILSLYENMIC